MSRSGVFELVTLILKNSCSWCKIGRLAGNSLQEAVVLANLNLFLASTSSSRIGATMNPLTVSCFGDFNCDDSVDLFEFLDFVDPYSATGPDADFNHDGNIDFFDYLDFVDSYSAGC